MVPQWHLDGYLLLWPSNVCCVAMYALCKLLATNTIVAYAASKDFSPLVDVIMHALVPQEAA